MDEFTHTEATEIPKKSKCDKYVIRLDITCIDIHIPYLSVSLLFSFFLLA